VSNKGKTRALRESVTEWVSDNIPLCARCTYDPPYCEACYTDVRCREGHIVECSVFKEKQR